MVMMMLYEINFERIVTINYVPGPPPFVPIVNSVDDTSNFEEFENERRLPNVDAFRTRQGFSGRNLPFVGFTYNRGKTNGEG